MLLDMRKTEAKITKDGVTFSFLCEGGGKVSFVAQGEPLEVKRYQAHKIAWKVDDGTPHHLQILAFNDQKATNSADVVVMARAVQNAKERLVIQLTRDDIYVLPVQNSWSAIGEVLKACNQ